MTLGICTFLFLETLTFEQQTVVFITAFTKTGVVSFQRHEESEYFTLSTSEGYKMYFSLLRVSTGVIPSMCFFYCLKYSANFPLSATQEFWQFIEMFNFVLEKKM